MPRLKHLVGLVLAAALLAGGVPAAGSAVRGGRPTNTYQSWQRWPKTSQAGMCGFCGLFPSFLACTASTYGADSLTNR